MRKGTLIVLLLAGLGLVAFLTLHKSEPKVLWVKDVAASWALAPAIGSNGTIYFSDETNNLCAVTRDGSLLWKTLLASISATPTAISIDASQTVYVVCETGELVALGPGGNVFWSRDLGVVEFAGTAFGKDNTLYVVTRSNRLYAISVDGPVKWEFRTVGEKLGGPVVGREGTIYFGCSDTNLYALNPDGTVKWICTNVAQLNSRPIVGADETIYLDCRERFHAISRDGQIKWAITNTSAGYYSAILDTSGTLFVCASDGVIALDAGTGTRLWKHAADAVPRCGIALASDGTIYFASYSRWCGIEALDRNGKSKWRFWREALPRQVLPALWIRFMNRSKHLGGNVAFTLTEDGRLYAIMADSKLYALQVSSGLATNAPWPMFKHDVRHSGATK